MKKESLWLLPLAIAIVFWITAMIVAIHNDYVGRAILYGTIFVLNLIMLVEYMIKVEVAKLTKKYDIGSSFIMVPVTKADTASCPEHAAQISYDRYTITFQGCLEHGADLALFVNGNAKEVAEHARTLTDAGSFLDQVAKRQQIPTEIVASLRAKLPELFPQQPDPDGGVH